MTKKYILPFLIAALLFLPQFAEAKVGAYEGSGGHFFRRKSYGTVKKTAKISSVKKSASRKPASLKKKSLAKKSVKGPKLVSRYPKKINHDRAPASK